MEWHDQGKAVPDPSLGEFQTWQYPRDLIAHLKGVQAKALVSGLLQRLENGFLFAAAGISSWRDEKGNLQKRYAPVSIQADWWRDAQGAAEPWQSLWTLGDISVRLYDISRGEFIAVALTAIRFEASSLYNDLTIPRPELTATNGFLVERGLMIEPNEDDSAETADSRSDHPLAEKAAAVAERYRQVAESYGYKTDPAPLISEEPSTAEAAPRSAPRAQKVSSATLSAWWELCKTLRPSNQWDADGMRAFFSQCLPDKSVTRDQLRDVRGKQKSGPKPTGAE